MAKCDKYCQDITHFQNEAARLSVCIFMCLSVVSALPVHCLISQGIYIYIYDCLIQRELQEAKSSVETMKERKATAEQQKQAVDKQCATLQVFYQGERE